MNNNLQLSDNEELVEFHTNGMTKLVVIDKNKNQAGFLNMSKEVRERRNNELKNSKRGFSFITRGSCKLEFLGEYNEQGLRRFELVEWDRDSSLINYGDYCKVIKSNGIKWIEKKDWCNYEATSKKLKDEDGDYILIDTNPNCIDRIVKVTLINSKANNVYEYIVQGDNGTETYYQNQLELIVE